MKVGYIRVSTREQNIARQEVLMEQLGVEKVYIDRCSGKNADRPYLKQMFADIHSGDVVIVEAISRFARNTRDLLALVDKLAEMGVGFISKKESLDTNSPAGRFMLTVFGACAELERAYILDRQREGIEIAKAQGKYSGENHKGRGRKEYDKELFEQLAPLVCSKDMTKLEASQRLGLSPHTFASRLAEWREARLEAGEDC